MVEVDTSEDPVRTSSRILAQLLSYTRQMSAYDKNPDINVAALTSACEQRLEDLKKVLPQALESMKDKSSIQGSVRAVQAQLILSMDVVEKAKAEASRQLIGLSKTRHAIRAYHR
ncbi:MAG: hypothetical protein ABFD97_05895 [Syntrophobacter sp.]